MGYAAQILKAIRYAESHLDDDLAIRDMARASAYSMYHFHRLFLAVTGETPGSYIRKRRLIRAAEALIAGDRTILDVAVEYRFGSQAAFTRAFQAQFGMPPGRFRRQDVFHCPMISPATIKSRLMHYRGGVPMVPEFVRLEKMFLVGMTYYGDNEHGEIPALWGRFGARMNRITNKKGFCAYGLCIEPDDYEETGKFQYIAALEVESLDTIPLEMVGKVLPAADYAVFTHKGPVTGLRETYEKIYGTWIAETDMEVIKGYDFELYDDRFKTPDDPESEIDIYIPIRKKVQ